MSELLQSYGPVALVTGASSGIGEAFARSLAEQGFGLLLVARREQRLHALARELAQQHGVSVDVLKEDLADPESPGRIAQWASAYPLGLLVSNAGFGLKGRHDTQSPAALTDLLNVNCHAPLLLVQALIPVLKQRERSALILTSSVEGLMGMPYSAAYGASKAFINSLAEGLWGELQPEGVDVLALCPGSTDTEAHDLQGIDRSTLEGMMSPGEVVDQALAAVGQGPVFIAGEHNRALFDGLMALPRREALLAMRDSMRNALLDSADSPKKD